MAAANTTKEIPSTPSGPNWPNEPEELLSLVPEHLNGSPYNMLSNILVRVHSIVAVLNAEFMGEGDYRPDDQEVVGALWTAQSQLGLARELLERLDVLET